MQRLHRSPLAPRLVLALAAAGVVVAACGESVTQITLDDVAELRMSVDSALVGIGRAVPVQAYVLDADGTLLSGQDVEWRSSAATIASVDEDGVVTGVALGTASIVASLGTRSDTTFVTVLTPQTLVLSADSVGFQAVAGGADPAPDTVGVTNAGQIPLVGLSADSILYGPGASGWLGAVFDTPTAPAELELTATSAGITTAGTYGAIVWVSAPDTEDSPASIVVTLQVTAGNPASLALNAGDAQTSVAGTAVAIAPSVRVEDAFGNPVAGATVTFSVTGGGGSVVGSSPTTNALGLAAVTTWTLGTAAGANELTATVGILTPVVFSATGVPGPATQVVVTGGNNQSAVAGSPVAVPPTVAVRDQHGNGVQGIAVTFAVASGGGGVTGAAQVSDTNGAATVGSWTLGLVAGANTLSVSAAGVANPAIVSATALSGAADSIYYVAGAAQSDTVAATLPTVYSVRVVDTNGNGVAGIPVTWSVTGGAGTIAGSATSTSVDTDANGYSNAPRVLGTVPGVHTASAAVGGLGGSPIAFSATASVGSPDEIAISTGNAQTATVATAVATDPRVIVRDKFDNPIAGHSVTFSVTGGGGSVNPITAITTDASGFATVTSWTLGTVAGTSNNSLRATAAAPGIGGQFVTFTASATPGAANSIAIVQGSGQTEIAGSAVTPTPTVVVRDQYNNVRPNTLVTFSVTGGGTRNPTSANTNASGQASTTWTLGTTGAMSTTGTFPNTLTATVSGTAISVALSGTAIYSYVTHVNQMWTATPSCTGCHGGTSGLTLSGTAAANRTALVNVNPTCDAGLAASGYRRVSTAGGTSGYNLSVIRVLHQGAGSDVVGTCGPHGTKLSAANFDILMAWIRNGAPNN